MESNFLQMAFQAHTAHINGILHEAIHLYSEILKKEQNYDILIARSKAQLEKNELQKSVDDALDAIMLDRQRYEGYYHAGLAKFRMGQIKAALLDFEEAIQKSQNNVHKNVILPILNANKNKCTAELQSKHYKEPEVKHQQQEQTKSQMEIEQPKKQELNYNPQPIQNAPGKITYRWYQTDNTVGIEINSKVDSVDKVKSTFEPKSVDISFPLEEGRTYSLYLDLFGEIIPEKSHVSVSLEKVTVTMEKKEKHKNWFHLEEQENTNKTEQAAPKKIEAPIEEQQGTYYPSSSKVKRDWDKINKELEKDLSKENDEDPTAFLFKQIYQNADEDTRRAMIKSYQESGGTALSTDWKDVQKKDYKGKDRPSAPKGMEWKTDK